MKSQQAAAEAAKEPLAKIQDRAQTQCERILNAAEHCFIKYGFHAASMANIADAAKMSAGLIYRYFANKNAIILAIIERQLQIMHEDMSALQSGVDLTARIGELFASWQQGQQRGMSPALYLELIAEATREPQIAEAVGRWHCVGTAEFNAWLKQVAKADGLTLTDEEVRQKAFAVSCFIDGLAIRAVREPGLDPAFVAESVRTFLPRLLASQKKPVGNE